MTAFDIAEMLADGFDFKDIFAGNIDAALERCIGVYDKGGTGKICIGGLACTKTKDKKVSILIHWTDNPTRAEKAAYDMYDYLTELRNVKAGSNIVKYITAKVPENIGKDERGICEYVIEAVLFYEESEE